MWQILPKKFPKIPWTMLLGPKFFTKMAKICHKKITELHHSILQLYVFNNMDVTFTSDDFGAWDVHLLFTNRPKVKVNHKFVATTWMILRLGCRVWSKFVNFFISIL